MTESGTKSDHLEILSFLRANPMATIATYDQKSRTPQSALIAFAELDDLRIIFETFYDTRKYRNLMADGTVSLVIGWDLDRYVTIQYEGRAAPIQDDQVDHYRQIFIDKKTPCTETFLYHPHVRLFLAEPTWVRYSDYTGKVPRITELSFPE